MSAQRLTIGQVAQFLLHQRDGLQADLESLKIVQPGRVHLELAAFIRDIGQFAWVLEQSIDPADHEPFYDNLSQSSAALGPVLEGGDSDLGCESPTGRKSLCLNLYEAIRLRRAVVQDLFEDAHSYLRQAAAITGLLQV